MKVAIVYKKDKVKDRSVIPSLIREFEKRKVQTEVLYSGSDLAKGADCAIVLGGDGALLHTAIIAGRLGIPVMGVNFGTLGFLSELEASEILEAPALVCGKHKLLPRTMLQIKLNGKEFYALNEVVLQRDYTKPFGNQVAEIGVKINGRKIQDYVLDGIALATPTGSTAYSLSAGGSILMPEAKVFILTPICSMSLFSRPIILSDDREVSFDLSAQHDPMKLYADGKPIGTITKESDLKIVKAPYTADFITRDPDRLFGVLNKKLLR
jgi:NAD+ kinase